MEYKGFNTGLKDVDVSNGIVCGYFANFSSKDSDGDLITPGAFAKTISENGPEGTGLIKFLLDHKRDQAIGKLTELKEDTIGLYYEAKAGRHTAGRDFLLMCEDGIINQHSFGFRTVKEQQKSDGNYISEVQMFEGSAIQFLGANRNTPLVGIKSLDETLDDLKALEKAMRNGKYSDEAFVGIEQQIKSLYSLIKPEPSTLKEEKPTIYQLINKGL